MGIFNPPRWQSFNTQKISVIALNNKRETTMSAPIRATLLKITLALSIVDKSLNDTFDTFFMGIDFNSSYVFVFNTQNDKGVNVSANPF